MRLFCNKSFHFLRVTCLRRNAIRSVFFEKKHQRHLVAIICILVFPTYFVFLETLYISHLLYFEIIVFELINTTL